MWYKNVKSFFLINWATMPAITTFNKLETRKTLATNLFRDTLPAEINSADLRCKQDEAQKNEWSMKFNLTVF